MVKEKAIVKFNRRKKFMKVWTTCKRCFLIAILLLGFLGWSQWAEAQKYPTRSITMLVNARPGAGTDVGSRLIAKEASKILGQEIIVMNKTGGGGTVATLELANSKADGYTLMGTVSDILLYPTFLESAPYDIKAFEPIIQFGYLYNYHTVRSDSPYKSFKDYIDFARKNPGKVSYGPPQYGTGPHLVMEHVVMEENVDIRMVPFQGSTPAITALLGGHIESCGVSTSVIMPHFKAGKVRLLATSTEKRCEEFPDIPTLAELGYPYGDAFSTIYLITAPKGTPSDIMKTLEEAFRKAMEAPEFLTYAKSVLLYVDKPLYGQGLKENLEMRYRKCGEIIPKIRGKK